LNKSFAKSPTNLNPSSRKVYRQVRAVKLKVLAKAAVPE